MRSSPIAIAVCAAVFFAAFEAGGEDYTVGFDTVVCAGGTGTNVSVPFRRPTSFSGTVSGAPAINTGLAILTAAGSPAFAAGAFTNEAHYLQFTGNGSRSGRVYSVTTNDASTITIDLSGDDLAGVADGDAFEVVPFWTLGTLLPKESQIAIHVSSGNLGPDRKTEVIFSGVAGARTYFLTATGWILSEPGFPAADDEVIPPRKNLLIRHPVGEAGTVFVTNQVVSEGNRIVGPDATVGKSLATQKGDGRYNRTGAGQKLKQVSKNRKKLKFIFTLQNDSDFHDTLSLTATPKDKYFKARYFRTSGGRTNVTAALKRDDYEKNFAGRAEEIFRLDVKPTRRALRMKKTFMIDAKSAGESLDRVKALVKAK